MGTINWQTILNAVDKENYEFDSSVWDAEAHEGNWHKNDSSTRYTGRGQSHPNLEGFNFEELRAAWEKMDRAKSDPEYFRKEFMKEKKEPLVAEIRTRQSCQSDEEFDAINKARSKRENSAAAFKKLNKCSFVEELVPVELDITYIDEANGYVMLRAVCGAAKGRDPFLYVGSDGRYAMRDKAPKFHSVGDAMSFAFSHNYFIDIEICKMNP